MKRRMSKSALIGAAARMALGLALVLGPLPGSWGAAAQTVSAAIAPGDLPPDPKPGECYAQVLIPDTTRKVAKRVLEREAAEELVVIPAEYAWVMRDVVVEEAAERIEITPAQYRVEQREVIIEPAREELTVIPAVFGAVTDEVKIRDAYQAWRKGSGPIQRYDHATGEIMNLVTIPEEYQTMTRQVVTEPARTEVTMIPAVTEMVEVKVMIAPPKAAVVAVPAVTRQMRVRELVAPARVERRPIPAEYQTVYETQNNEEARVDWRPVLCEADARPDLIAAVQRALDDAGFDPGKVDGHLGKATMRAVDLYQRKHALARNFLTIETIEHLGVDPKADG